MAETARKQFHIDELTDVFRAIAGVDWPCVLVGGQAASFWGRRRLPHEPPLLECARPTPFVSKEVDLQGDLTAARRLAAISRQRHGVPANLPAVKTLTLPSEHAEPLCVPAPAVARAARYLPARRA